MRVAQNVGFLASKIPKYRSQNVAVPPEMDGTLNFNKNTVEYFILTVGYYRFSSKTWLMVSLFASFFV